jgi:hypothetical protein
MLHPLEQIMLMDEAPGVAGLAGITRLLPDTLERARGLGLVLVGTDQGMALFQHSNRLQRLGRLVASWSNIEQMLGLPLRKQQPTPVHFNDYEVNLWVQERRATYEAMIHICRHAEALKDVGLFLMGTRFGIDVLERAPLAGARAAASTIIPMPQRVARMP